MTLSFDGQYLLPDALKHTILIRPALTLEPGIIDLRMALIIAKAVRMYCLKTVI